MDHDYRAFEDSFGIPIPAQLISLCTDASLIEMLPAGFRFSHVSFVLEIQHFLDILDPQNYSVSDKRLSFAVTTDGFKLLVDLGGDDLDILQSEFEDVDSIGLRVRDLLAAERYPICCRPH